MSASSVFRNVENLEDPDRARILFPSLTFSNDDSAEDTSPASSSFCSPMLRIALLVTAVAALVLTPGASEDKSWNVIDVDAPPVPTQNNRTVFQQLQELPMPRVGRSKRQMTIGEALSKTPESVTRKFPFPVVNANEDIPNSITPPASTFAADALECRQSVINFVINATDAKDECTGLTKAFDKTCSGESSAEKPKTNQTAAPPATTRRRKLFESTTSRTQPSWRFFCYKLSRSVHQLTRKYIFPPEEGLFFADQEILQVWDETKYQVENSFDKALHKDVRRRLEAGRELRAEAYEVKPDTPAESTEKATAPPETEKAEAATEAPETSEAADAENATQPEATLPPQDKPKPKQSLTLPTASQHVSGEVLSETLMLQQGTEVIAAANAATNQTLTNKTMNEAQVSAAASSKAVAETAAAVSAVLNDPDSVEARACCASILNVFHENCDSKEEEVVSDRKLFIIVFIIAFCGMVKSLIRHFKIRWLPEAGGCIIVGVATGAFMSFIPAYNFSFDGDWFLRIMVPPIVFEAALSIDKKSFTKHMVPIMFYATLGTLMATLITATIVHKGSVMLGGWCETFPYVEALIFGALISSIDPIAVLSVLSNLGMTDTDTIYVIIFGESLLNDGVAIVLFHTLVHFLDENLEIDSEAVMAGALHFIVVALGSVFVGAVSGMVCTVYYWAFRGCQTPLVEVLMFFCWAFIPYYICDGVGWSGIVAVVTTGFLMDLYVVGQNTVDNVAEQHSLSNISQARLERKSFLRKAFSKNGHLSVMARTHVGFVTEILSTMMETAIFAYLGFFLFSYRYHWNFWHSFLSIFACCASRAIMIPCLSFLANRVTSLEMSRNRCRQQSAAVRRNPGVIVDARMQLVLWFAGLRGAMSFALVEHIPLYDEVTGEGSRLKPEMKAMTSASIVFTVFILGGYTYYMIERLGMTPAGKRTTSFELASLLPQDLDDGRSTPNDNGNVPSSPVSPVSPVSSPDSRKTFRHRQKSDVGQSHQAN